MIPIKFSTKSKAQHYLYVKEHSVRESHVTKPRDKTLFVLNVPPYCNKVKTMKTTIDECQHKNVQYMFQLFGKTINVITIF